LVLAVGGPLGSPVEGCPLKQEVPAQSDPALLEAGERILGHRFVRQELLAEAMTHRSAARKLPGHRRGAGSNERLEFIGDRVLGLVMAEWLIERFAHEQEGELGRRLAQLVAQPALAAVAEALGMTEILAVSPGEERAGVKNRATVTADALEAAIGALYLDGGLPVARDFIRRSWEPALAAQEAPPKDAKSALQEWALARGMGLPLYTVTSRIGPSHNPIFVVSVRLEGPGGASAGEAKGEAGSKRVAEHRAAATLLARLPA
jgi:ribonuclease-3